MSVRSNTYEIRQKIDGTNLSIIERHTSSDLKRQNLTLNMM